MIDPVALWIGPVPVRWYGLAYATGLLLGWHYAQRLARRAGVQSAAVDHLAGAAIIGAVVGGRLGHVLLYQPDVYMVAPWRMLALWQGGMSFHGGIAGVAIGVAWTAWRHELIFLCVADLAAAAAPIGIGLGRLANYVNGEIVGSVTAMPWGVVFPGYGPEPRHPAMLYEAAAEGAVLFAVLAWGVRRGWLATPGRVTAVFLLGYGVARIACESTKATSWRLVWPDWQVTFGMIYSLPLLTCGAALIVRRSKE